MFSLCFDVLRSIQNTPLTANEVIAIINRILSEPFRYGQSRSSIVYFNFQISEGLNEIIQNFTAKGGFLNKLSSFYKRSKNNLESRSIIMKSLNKTDITKIKLNEFLSLNIIYAGFVLHEHTGKVEKYTGEEFYNNFEISADKISKNIAETLGKEIETNHKIILFHLPIKNKMELIDKIIENAQKIRMDIQNENSCK